MKRWPGRIAIAAALIAVVGGVFFESVTRVGRGWLYGEPFYDGRPASYWANEIERWESQNANWETQTYVRRATLPRWVARMLPEPTWPQLLDGDPYGLAVLHALRNHPSSKVQDWAQIGIERIDNDERGPFKFKHPSVIVTAQLYEVDEAFYKELAKAKWCSTTDLDKLQRIWLGQVEDKQKGESLFEALHKQKLVLAAKEIKLDLGKEGVLLSLTKEINCLPSPAQLRKGQKGPQKLAEGVALRAQVQISADRRFVRVTFIEKCSELEGIEKVPLVLDAKGEVVLDAKGAVAVAEVVYVKEAAFSAIRNIPDGGTFLLPLQNRPTSAKEKGRWLVARIVPRIYIEAEEERQLRAEPEN